jgi:hypothetical protein
MKKKSSSKKKSSGIESKIKDISELDFSLTALFSGPSGTGKTTLSATFPKKILLLDIREQGTDSISDVKGIQTVEIDSWDELEEIYWHIDENPEKWKTVVIDAVHAMQALAILKSKTLNGKSEDDQTSKRDFGTASGLMNQWIINFRDLSKKYGINVVFISHTRTDDPEGDSDDADGSITPIVGPNVMPSVGSTLTGCVKVVGHTFIRQTREKSKIAGKKSKVKTEYALRVGPHAYYTTKIRNPKSKVVPDYLIDPSYEKIVQVMKGEFVNSSNTNSDSKRKLKLKKR